MYKLLGDHEQARGREAARRCCGSLQLVSLQSDVALLQDPLKSMLCLFLTLIAGPMPDGEDDLEKLHTCKRFGTGCLGLAHSSAKACNLLSVQQWVNKNNSQELPSSPAKSEKG